jgi:AcrR family transcriptional regulator
LIEIAVRLVAAGGAGALTMRGLAEAAGVTPMALYNHVSSKRDLLAAVAEKLISTAAFDGGHTDWRAQLRHCFGSLRDLCLRHPGLPALLEHEGAAPAGVFAPMEVTLRALRGASLGELDSVRAFYLLAGFTLSQAAYQSRGPVPGLDPAEQIRAGRLAGRGLTATEQLALPAAWDFDASFAFGLDVVLDGIAARITE